MQKTFLPVIISGLILSGAAVATTHDLALEIKDKNAVKQPSVSNTAKAASANVTSKVNLYAAPKFDSAILEATTPNTRLIPIYSQGDWLKVGDPQNGNVGWINKSQYRAALSNWYQASVQTVIVRQERDQNGKPVISIVAYSNGKKLDDKQAQAMYENLQKRQHNDWEAMNHFQENINQFFARENHYAAEDFNSVIFDHPFAFEPGPVIIVKDPAAKEAANTSAPEEKKSAPKQTANAGNTSSTPSNLNKVEAKVPAPAV